MTTHPSRRVRANRSSAGLPALTAVAGAAMLLASGAVLAQEATTTQTITVTGIRAAIESAINTKKNAEGIVEAISAEDIGKLPDPSIAESVARLPGVTAQRNKSTGRASSISVRGMSADFNAGTLNGREQASTSDSRGVEFDQFPSELLGQVVIYKTPDAGLMNQGLASTIDLRTVRPLDFGKRTVAVNFRKQRSGVDSGAEEGDGDRASLSYIDQFADRTIGVALGFARFNDKGAEQQKFNSWGGWTPEVDYNGQMVKTPGGFTADTESTTFTRDGLMAVLQFKPNKSFESVLDLFSSKGDFKISKKGLEGAIGGQSAGGYDPAGQLINATVVDGVATAGTITNYKGVVRNHDERVEDKLDSFGWNNKLKVADWTAELDLSQSKVKRLGTRYETTAGQVGNANLPAYAANVGTISWTGFNGGNHDQVQYSTSLNYADPSIIKLTDVMGWSGGESSPQAGYVALPTTIDKISATRLSGKRAVEWGPVTELQIGANLQERDKIHTANEGRLVIAGTTDPYGAANVPSPGTAIAGTTGLSVISWNPQGSLGSIYDLPPKVDRDILNKDWSVNEKLTTLFAKGAVETELFGRAVLGNVGVQFVSTKQSGVGYYLDAATCTGNTPETCPATRIENGTSYNDVLPSLNLSMDLGNDQVLRMGLAKVQSRPSMADMRGSATFSLNNAPTDGGGPRLEGSGGNPWLKPFQANALDLSYEKYFGSKGYISVAGFHKDLSTYVIRQTKAIPVEEFGVPGNLPFDNVFFTQPVNGTGGSLSGVEVALSLPFSMLTPALEGFGVQVNYSNTDSSVSLPPGGLNVNDVGSGNLPLPGLSREVTNLRLYYEKSGFQVSLGARSRSSFLGEITDFQDNRQLTFVSAETVVDLQLGYEFQTGIFKGLSLLFQGNNLTNSEFKRFNGDTGNIVERVRYGKTYLFGLNYKL